MPQRIRVSTSAALRYGVNRRYCDYPRYEIGTNRTIRMTRMNTIAIRTRYIRCHMRDTLLLRLPNDDHVPVLYI